MIKFTIDEAASKKVIDKISNATVYVEDSISMAIKRAAAYMQLKSRDMLPPYKGNPTGTLARSISISSLTGKSAEVGSNLDYARIQDLGGVITPKAAKYLRFKIDGQWIATKRVTIPKHNSTGYLTPAFEDVKKNVIKTYISEELNRKFNN